MGDRAAWIGFAGIVKRQLKWKYGPRGGFQEANYDMADAYFTAKFALKVCFAVSINFFGSIVTKNPTVRATPDRRSLAEKFR